ncbi:MAG: tetratricopeptide repeat protein [Methylococcaceae bacterium]
MADPVYQAQLDGIWRKLRPHLEYAKGFALAVLFSDHPAPVQALRQRLIDMLSLNTLPFRCYVLNRMEQTDVVLTAVLAARPLAGQHTPLWLETPTEDNPEQRRALWQLLSRLNERRFLLERNVACPLVLILPQALRYDVSSMLPDLWSVCCFTADLPQPIPQQPVSSAAETFRTDLAVSRSATAAEVEWQRLWLVTEDKSRLSADAGFAAIEAAFERMDYAVAERIITELLPLVRRASAQDEDMAAKRNYSIALDFSGDLNAALGRLEDARAAYRESLALRCQLREALGDAPQTLRDLSVSLNKVGNVETALGRLEDARAFYEESRTLSAKLVQAFPNTPQYCQDLIRVEKRLAAFEVNP